MTRATFHRRKRFSSSSASFSSSFFLSFFGEMNFEREEEEVFVREELFL